MRAFPFTGWIRLIKYFFPSKKRRKQHITKNVTLFRVAQCHHARSARYRLSQNLETVARCAVFSDFVNWNRDSLKPERAKKLLALFFAHDNKRLIRKIKRADYESEAF
jgi:hypothetical protein